MLILGVDPGLRATGYALMHGSPQGVHLIEFGTLRTDAAADLPARLRLIHTALRSLLDRSRPDLVVVEDLYAAQRYPRTAILMGHVRGVICLAAAELNIAVSALPPAAVKQAIAGFGGASKSQIQLAVLRLLRRPGPFDTHIADAVAMALTALSRSGVPLQAATEPVEPPGFVMPEVAR